VKRFFITILLFFLFVPLSSFGSGLNETQLNIVKVYPTWTQEQKISLFYEIANQLAKNIPMKVDWATECVGVSGLSDRPGLLYVYQLAPAKQELSEEKWDQLFKEIKTNHTNSSCSSPSTLFLRKLKHVTVVHDYFDKNNVFLKRIAVDFSKACSE
jgi:hypothetical protein